MAAGARQFGASVIGWLIVAILVVVFFGGLLSFVGFLLRAALFVFVIAALLWAYFRLKGD